MRDTGMLVSSLRYELWNTQRVLAVSALEFLPLSRPVPTVTAQPDSVSLLKQAELTL